MLSACAAVDRLQGDLAGVASGDLPQPVGLDSILCDDRVDYRVESQGIAGELSDPEIGVNSKKKLEQKAAAR